MTKVTVHEQGKPQAPAAPKQNSITDSKGRAIKLREIDPLQESRLILAVGAQAALNIAYLNAYVLPAAMVEYIDEDYYGCPTSQAQVDAMLKVLGREGLSAIMQHMAAQIGDEKDERAAAKN